MPAGQLFTQGDEGVDEFGIPLAAGPGGRWEQELRRLVAGWLVRAEVVGGGEEEEEEEQEGGGGLPASVKKLFGFGQAKL